MAGILNQEWLNSNGGRNYPIEENMSRVPRDPSGIPLAGVTVPNSLLVDMTLTMPGAAGVRVYLGNLVYTGTLLSLVFRAETNGSVVSGISFDPTAHAANSAYNIVGSGAWEDVRGWVNIGDLATLAQELPQGAYEFTAADTLLEARVVRPALRGVRSIAIENMGNVSARLYDHVKLIAGQNIRLEYDSANNGIWVHAANNAGYSEACECENTRETNVVRTINGVAVEDVTIQGDGECVQVTTSGNRIMIKDVCSEPCCGCPELDYLNNNMKILESSLATLTDYANRLHERITTFITNFVLTN